MAFCPIIAGDLHLGNTCSEIRFEPTMEQKGDDFTDNHASTDNHDCTDDELQQKLSEGNESSPIPPKRDSVAEKAETQSTPVYARVKKRQRPLLIPYSSDSETQSTPVYARVKKRQRPLLIPYSPDSDYKPGSTAASMTCLKKSMIVVHLLIWLLGAIITALGIYMKVDKDFLNIQEELGIKEFGTSTTILIIVGVVIMVIGFCGCWGAIASKIWMLVIFSIVMIIIIILEIAAIALVWTSVASQSMQEDVKLKAKNALQHIADDDKKRYFIDLIQRKLDCCGVDGPNDYTLDVANAKTIPHSCYAKDSSAPYQKGCYAAVIEFLKSKAAIVGGVAVAVLLLQLGVLVFTVCLICSIKNSATNLIF